MHNIEGKKIFLIAAGSPKQNEAVEAILNEHFYSVTAFTATDGVDASFKAENVTPHVVILDYNLARMNTVALTEKLIRKKDRTAVIILDPEPEEQHFIDEVVTGQVQFLSGVVNVTVFVNHINRALNWAASEQKSMYQLKFFSEGDWLLREGEEGKFVYLVKHGRLKAFKKNADKETILGYIEPGEFVGEMAYINGEPRSADVVCLTETELIEIPSGALDSILFSKPAWSKALMKTLSRRLKDFIDET